VIKRIATRSKFLKRGEGSASLLQFQKYYHVRYNLRGYSQSCHTHERLKKMYFAKESSASTWRRNIIYKFYTQKERFFFNITYVHSTEHRAVHLMRHYNLTNTGYKFLEIRINVLVHRVMWRSLGDHRGHELSLKTWKSLYEQRWKILRNEYKDNFINVGSLTIRIILFARWTMLVHFNSSSVRITIEMNATPYVWRWIDVTFEWLARFVV